MSTTEMSGWLRDPTGRYEQRYWDGQRWTEHVARGGLKGTDPLASSPPTPAEAQSPEEMEAQALVRSEQVRRSSRRTLVVALAVAAVLVGLVVFAAARPSDDPWSRRGGTSAKVACADAVVALREMAAGTRSAASTVGALEDAEVGARRAARLDANWTPVARSIVGARAELLAGQPGDDTRALITNCGLGS